jgi:HlyD family secretion protein
VKSLCNAKLPLELRELEVRLSEARRQVTNEVEALKDIRELRQEELVSEQDVKQQEAKASAARAQADALAQQRDLTLRYLHPAAVERAQATLSSAAQDLALARTQISNGVVRAPSGGVVAYKPLSIGGEFRTVRVGDTVFKNQPFMTLSDMSNLVMHGDVPEAELSRTQAGFAAVVEPMAYPDATLTGKVEFVGSMARSVAGRDSSQRYFSVRIRLDGTDARLRSGMSARARILSYCQPRAVLVPRAAVWWEGGRAFCSLWKGSRAEKTALTPGMADDMQFEVLNGVRPGDRIVMP